MTKAQVGLLGERQHDSFQSPQVSFLEQRLCKRIGDSPSQRLLKLRTYRRLWNGYTSVEFFVGWKVKTANFKSRCILGLCGYTCTMDALSPFARHFFL